MMSLFIRITLATAGAIVALVVLLFLLKILVVAALIAGLAIAGAFAVRAIGQRYGPAPDPVGALSPRR